MQDLVRRITTVTDHSLIRVMETVAIRETIRRDIIALTITSRAADITITTTVIPVAGTKGTAGMDMDRVIRETTMGIMADISP